MDPTAKPMPTGSIYDSDNKCANGYVHVEAPTPSSYAIQEHATEKRSSDDSQSICHPSELLGLSPEGHSSVAARRKPRAAHTGDNPADDQGGGIWRGARDLAADLEDADGHLQTNVFEIFQLQTPLEKLYKLYAVYSVKLKKRKRTGTLVLKATFVRR
ncbi:uncharacterized protein BCR38DRAFT_490871 [Pseudomassariella vexata]|uniref:Uncharacterized protein n=1 Tax=Pseudomassariella vexata TaxID=1141098 RepID=A0A1Y2D9R4_9PEZI|nr:uncharacterized protein BCR38DRAFT_490871 [Pseudomassariella vexata]ORY55866.1 hypothetical protein BCR38DRAFT_490871 [Pseudomassariella vexata]